MWVTPERNRKLPEILTPDEVALLIDSASNLYHRTLLMTLYSTGMRRAEMCRLKVSDVDKKGGDRMPEKTWTICAVVTWMITAGVGAWPIQSCFVLGC